MDEILARWTSYDNDCYYKKEDFLKNKNLEEYNKLVNYCYNNINNSDCLYFIGFISYLENDCDKAINLYSKATKLNNMKAMYKLAILYESGIGVRQNYDKAINLYNQAIELGNHRAMNHLAILYETGEGVEQDYDKAINLYNRAIELGDTNAMHNLAWLYENGVGVEQDYDKAIELYNKAIKLGNTNAMTNLALLYKNGEGIEQNYSKALILFCDCIKFTENNYDAIYCAEKLIFENIDYFTNKYLQMTKEIKNLQNEIDDKDTYISQLENLPFGKEYYNTLENFNKMLNKNI